MAGAPNASSEALFLKTKLCRFHQAGKCARGADCRFAHTRREVKPLPNFSRTKLCPDLRQTGRCPYGDACKFAHSVDDLRARTKGHARLIDDLRSLLHTQNQGTETPVPAVPPVPDTSAHSDQAGMQSGSAAVQAQQVVFQTPIVGCQVGPQQTVQAPDTVVSVRPVQVAIVQTPWCGGPYVLVPCGGIACMQQTQLQEAVPESTQTINCEDEDLDLVSGSWSRQSTAEPSRWSSEGSTAEPSRWSSEGSWEEVLDMGEDQRNGLYHADLSPTSVMPSAGSTGRMSPNAVQTEFQAMAAVCGLTYSVKNSFLAFSDDWEIDPVRDIKRAHSTGDLLAQAI